MMKPILPRAIFTSLALMLSGPALADELRGAALLDRLSGQSFTCTEGETSFAWSIAQVTADAQDIPYTAVIKGKTFESNYVMNAQGRPVQSTNDTERRIETGQDGQLTVTQSNGRQMTCVQP